MDIEAESNLNKQSQSGSSRSGSSNSGSRSASGSRSGSSDSNSASRSSASKSSKSYSRSGSGSSKSRTPSHSRSGSESDGSASRSSSGSRSRSASESSNALRNEEQSKPVVEEIPKLVVEETKPIVKEAKPVEEKIIPIIEEVKPVVEENKPNEVEESVEEAKPKEEEAKPIIEENKPVVEEEKSVVEEEKPKIEEKPKEEESKLDKNIIDKYLDILNSLHNNYEKDIDGLKMKIKDHTLLDYLTLIIKSNMIYASYTDSINTIINKISIVGSETNLNLIDETIKSVNTYKSEEEIKKAIDVVKNQYICLKDCHDLLIQLITKLLKDVDSLKQFNESKSIEEIITKWNNRNNNQEYISIGKYYEYVFDFIEFLSKIFLSEPPPPPIPNLDYDEFCFKEKEFVNVYHYQSKQYRVARIYSILNGIYTVKYLSGTVLKFKANLLYPVLKPQDNVIFHLPSDSTPYDGIVVSNIHNNNYWILAKNRRRYYVPIDHLSTNRRYDIGSEVKVFYMDKFSNGVIISIEYNMRDTYYMIRLYEENEDLLPERLEKCKTILKNNDN